jgi:hypothetical protein
VCYVLWAVCCGLWAVCCVVLLWAVCCVRHGEELLTSIGLAFAGSGALRATVSLLRFPQGGVCGGPQIQMGQILEFVRHRLLSPIMQNRTTKLLQVSLRTRSWGTSCLSSSIFPKKSCLVQNLESRYGARPYPA